MSKKLSPDVASSVVNFRLSDDELAKVDRLADKAGLTRSQYIRNLIATGVEEVEVMEKFGIIRAVITIRDIAEWMGDKSKKYC